VAQQARADDALAQAIVTGERETLERYEAGLKGAFPEAERIRVILPSDTNPDMSVRPPIGYACLDLARQAEAGTERPPMELHLQGSDFAHLDLVRPIRHGEMVVASLMVSYTPQKIQGWIKGLALESGYLELQQGWDGPILGYLGDATSKRALPSHRAVIPGSTWQLSYWAGDGIGIADAQKLGFFATFAIAAGVGMVVMLIYSRFMVAIIKRELDGMVLFMEESSRGKRFHSYPVKLVEVELALHRMEPVLQAAKPNAGIKDKAEKGDSGVPDMMFMDFGEITVEEGGESPQGDNKR